MTDRDSAAQRNAWLKKVQALPHDMSTYNGWGCRCAKCKAARQRYDHVYNLERRGK